MGRARPKRAFHPTSSKGAAGVAHARSAIRTRLHARRGEIEQALLTRVYGIADPSEIDDSGYVAGFRTAAAAALDFAFATLESSEDRLPLVPPILLSQARLAARNGVGIDTVLRRYTAGHALLVDFLIEEVEREPGLPPAELRRILVTSSSAFDRLLASVSEEHAREQESYSAFSKDFRGAECVKRLLAGEPIDVSELSYDFHAWHLGIAAQGNGAKEQIAAISADLDCRVLVISADDELVWAWLGSRDPLDAGNLVSTANERRDDLLALGEPCCGLQGWRLTHRQAMAALPIAVRGEEQVVRYADVALIAAVLENDLLCTSLRTLYLDQLARERDGGETLRHTLDAYFTAGRSLTSAAALMGVSRRTISNRLQRVEKLIGKSCHAAGPELETVLRLDRCLNQDTRSRFG